MTYCRIWDTNSMSEDNWRAFYCASYMVYIAIKGFSLYDCKYVHQNYDDALKAGVVFC